MAGNERGRKTAWSALTIVVLALVIGSCSDGRSDSADTTTTVKPTPTTTATTTTADPPSSTTTEVTADPVLVAYLAFWDVYVALGGTPPPFDPAAVTDRLREVTTGAETQQLFDFLQNNAATGLVLRGDLDHSPTVVSNDGTVAVVEDCLDDRLGVYRIADDVRIDTDDPDRRLYTVTLRQDGQWRVETVSMGAEPCTP
jgi:hypothetical protein